MRARLEVVNPAPVFVDLTQKEDEGGLGGPIFLAVETLAASIDTEAEMLKCDLCHMTWEAKGAGGIDRWVGSIVGPLD